MQKITMLNNKRNIDPRNYANTETGETLASEIGKGKNKTTVTEEPEYFSISSDNYVVFDAAAITYISKILPKADLGRVLNMGNMIKGDCSVLYQDSHIPHGSESLAVALELSIDKFYKLVRKLVKQGIISYCVCAPSGYVQKIYMLNPYIARNKRVLNCELITFFNDITKVKI